METCTRAQCSQYTQAPLLGGLFLMVRGEEDAGLSSMASPSVQTSVCCLVSNIVIRQ